MSVTRVTGPVRARDLRRNISELGFEQGVVGTLELLLEEHAAVKQQIRDTVKLVDMCINQVEQLIKIGTGMQDKIDNMNRLIDQGDDSARH